MNVVITSASRKVWLVRAFQKALSLEGGGKVIAVDASPMAPSLYVADEGVVVPRGLGIDFFGSLIELCRQRDVALIVPTRDEELPFFARHEPQFKDVGVTVAVSNIKAIEICRDKQAFQEFCHAHGLAVPRAFDLKGPCVFPAVIKERFGKGSSSVLRVADEAQLKAFLPRYEYPIVQEAIDAPEFTVDVFVDSNGQIISIVPRQRLVVVGGESYVGRTVKHLGIIEETKRLLGVLDLRWHNTVQCFLRGEQVIFLEVNPRYGGGANLGFAAGCPTPLYLIRLLKGKKVMPAIGDFEEGLTMLRYATDLFLTREELDNVQRIDPSCLV